MFIRAGKFSLTQDVYLLKPTKAIDLNINVKLLTLQLTNIGFNYCNKINRDKLSNIEVYLLVNDKVDNNKVNNNKVNNNKVDNNKETI